MSLSAAPAEQSESRIIAAAAYLSFFVLPLVGPLLLFFLLRSKSNFVRFHSAQAFNAQVTCMGIEVAGVFMVMFLSLAAPASYTPMLVLVAVAALTIGPIIFGVAYSALGKMVRFPRWVALPLMK